MTNPGPPCVLVVDDDPVCRRFVRDTLEAAGLHVEIAATLAAARQALAARRFACVVFDLGLPDGAGIELAADARRGSVPCIAISAELSTARARELERAGCVAALEKPLRAGALVAAVGAASAGLPVADVAAPKPARGSAQRADVHDDDVVLDEHAALAAAGTRAIADGLRALFAAELGPSAAAIEAALADGDAETARAVLHRLRAACGFCGANRLRAASESLARAAPQDGAASWQRFAAALAATRAALDDAPIGT